jgi:hypothetical protein
MSVNFTVERGDQDVWIGKFSQGEREDVSLNGQTLSELYSQMFNLIRENQIQKLVLDLENVRYLANVITFKRVASMLAEHHLAIAVPEHTAVSDGPELAKIGSIISIYHDTNAATAALAELAG